MFCIICSKYYCEDDLVGNFSHPSGVGSGYSVCLFCIEEFEKLSNIPSDSAMLELCFKDLHTSNVRIALKWKE